MEATPTALLLTSALCCASLLTSILPGLHHSFVLGLQPIADALLGHHRGQESRRGRSGGLGHMGVKFAHAMGAHFIDIGSAKS